MGCCVSKLDEDSTTDLKQNPLHKDHKFSCVSKSPPRPEEETVKEVLSETPKPKPKPDSRPIHIPELEPEIRAHKNDDEEKPTKAKLIVSPKKPLLVQKLPSLDKKLPSLEKKLSSLEQNGLPIKETTTMKYHHHHQHQHPDPSTPEEEISEVSEMCSMSETISTTTLEDHQQQQWAVKDSATSGEMRQRGFRSQGHNSNLLYNHSNYSGNYNNNNNNVQLRNHGRSPVRRADPSPPRRRYPGPGQVQPGPKRDVVGENSARRSRSPATRSNVSRSPSAKRNGPSPGRVRMVHGPEEVRKVEEENNNMNVRRNGNGNEWDGPKESLENPLVSLECFIFL